MLSPLQSNSRQKELPTRAAAVIDVPGHLTAICSWLKCELRRDNYRGSLLGWGDIGLFKGHCAVNGTHHLPLHPSQKETDSLASNNTVIVVFYSTDLFYGPELAGVEHIPIRFSWWWLATTPDETNNSMMKVQVRQWPLYPTTSVRLQHLLPVWEEKDHETAVESHLGMCSEYNMLLYTSCIH